jgi:hypothetical protein
MGKASILLVVGYSVILLMSGLTLSGVSVQAYDNAMGYFERTASRDIAIAGANMAANQLFLVPPLMSGNPWFPGYTTPVKLGNGTFTVTVDSTTSIDPSSGERRLTMRATGRYGDSVSTVMVILAASKFSKFAFYAGVSASNAYWETGDSCFGPAHSEGTLKAIGTPYFEGKVTVKNGVDSSSAGAAHPVFKAGLETGVSVPMNKNFQRLGQNAASGGKLISGTPEDLHIAFQGDSVRWHRGTNPDTTSLFSSWAPNGAVVLNKGNVYVKGVVKGRCTLAALDSSSTSKGKVFVEDNITYNTDPRTNPASLDMLGVIAYNEVTIKDNGSALFTVMGSVFSYKKGVTVDNYSTRTPGILYTLGGWIVENVYATSNGIPLGSPGSRGYKVGLHYDERFRTTAPPFFPGTNSYEILAWYE